MKECVLETTSISKNTYYKIQKESDAVLERGNSLIESPRKTQSKKSTKCSVDNFHLSFIKQTVNNNYFITNKVLPTCLLYTSRCV